MVRRFSWTEMHRVDHERVTQPILVETAFAGQQQPVPSLGALEQIGGPELDGPLALPDRTAWSSRLSDLFPRQ